MAANDDDVFIRPRGRVLLAQTPAPDARWRDRLRRSATTEARRLEYELSLLAARALARGWPQADGAFVGLRASWIVWVDRGVERTDPDWKVAVDGRLISEDGHLVVTDELALALVRLDVCDHLPAAQARRAYGDQVDLVRRNVANCLGHLESRLLEGPPPTPVNALSPAADELTPRRLRGRRRSG